MDVGTQKKKKENPCLTLVNAAHPTVGSHGTLALAAA